MPVKISALFRWLLVGLLLLATSPAAAQRPMRLPPAPLADLQQDSVVVEVGAEAFGIALANDPTAQAYPKASVLLQTGNVVQFQANVPATGAYILLFDGVAAPTSARAPEAQLQIDGAFPVADLQRVQFPLFYRNSADTFPQDRYGNETLIRQTRTGLWRSVAAWDVGFSDAYPLRLNLSAGEHQFTFALNEGALYLGSVYLKTFAPYPAYAQYQAALTAATPADFTLTLEAERPTYKNNSAVRPASDRGLTVTPYDTYRLLLNTLGGDNWTQSGSAVYYEFDVPTAGFYAITLRALQNTRSNFTVFRRITVNGVVPFAELNAMPFGYTADWVNVPLGGDGATPYKIFLPAGKNVLGLEATNAPYAPAVATIQQALLDINTLALEVKQLTGNQQDPYKEWVISDYIPDIQTRLDTIAQHLIADKAALVALNPDTTSPELLTYQMAIDNLQFLAADPNKLPVYLGRFSEGSGSAAQSLGSLLPLLQKQPLALDKIYIHALNVVPAAPTADPGQVVGEGFKRFVRSFAPDPYRTLEAEADELEVWVNRPRQYVDLLQQMADESFTPQTGVRVKFSLMPAETKLILANAANIQPDVALGISTDIPYELAIRNALYDLRSFDDFDAFIHVYAPGALLSYIINDAVYALPETQDFWVTFYRQDILDALHIPVPHTWPEVIEILPELQRAGMNYNTPLSGSEGQKRYLMTAPYLFNYGAQLYSEDGFATGLQSEEAIAGFRFMAESFTLYGMPLSTASFYESFRYGTLPIGVSNLETYIKLTTAAPEIAGRWNLDLYPATVLPDGTQNRYATGSAQASLMFKNTDKPAAGWQFLKWWLSTETQVDFQERLVLNYGPEYLWSSANLEAFQQSAMPEAHKQVILAQWQWLLEPVKLPGSYMQEREISNVWNRMVFDGANPRVALDRSITAINREITRKMEELGYLQNGQRVKEFKIPTLETVQGWIANAQ